MNFWSLFKKDEEKVKVKSLTLSYYEVHQVLNQLDEEYKKIITDKNHQQLEVARHGRLFISKIRKKIKSFIKNKYELD